MRDACNSKYRVLGCPMLLEFFELYLEKSTFFRIVLESFLNSEFLTISFLGYNISSYNRPSHQVTVGPNWSWVSLSKLPYLLDALWPIAVTPDHFLVFQNERPWSKNYTICGNILFVYSLQINGGCILFLLYFLIFVAFTINLTDDIFSSTIGLQIIFNCY